MRTTIELEGAAVMVDVVALKRAIKASAVVRAGGVNHTIEALAPNALAALEMLRPRILDAWREARRAARA